MLCTFHRTSQSVMKSELDSNVRLRRPLPRGHDSTRNFLVDAGKPIERKKATSLQGDFARGLEQILFFPQLLLPFPPTKSARASSISIDQR
jgi:hypothetical protein